MIQGSIKINGEQVLASARRVLTMEADCLQTLSESLGNNFIKAVEMILKVKGRVVVTGIGKSGHIAGKIAATMASTGTPSFFVHPSELNHGDFGMLTEDDLVIAISNSGETQEVTGIIVPIKRRGIPLLGITSNLQSRLAEHSDLVLDLMVKEEACPLNLAPTTSTTATLALGDALAVSLMEQRKFTADDFAKFHPGGNIGRKLLKVEDIMRKSEDEIPKIFMDASFVDVLKEISDRKLGFTTVVSPKGELEGIITDGDLRRAFLKFGGEVEKKKASDVMNDKPKVIAKELLAYEALKVMETHRISDLIILDKNQKPIGVIDLKDLLKAGIY
jgi:arabinose-5-phosphate isomerase